MIFTGFESAELLLWRVVIKVHAAFESASKQLAQHPTTGLFFINVSFLVLRTMLSTDFVTVVFNSGPRENLHTRGPAEAANVATTTAGVQGALLRCYCCTHTLS